MSGWVLSWGWRDYVAKRSQKGQSLSQHNAEFLLCLKFTFLTDAYFAISEGRVNKAAVTDHGTCQILRLWDTCGGWDFLRHTLTFPDVGPTKSMYFSSNAMKGIKLFDGSLDGAWKVYGMSGSDYRTHFRSFDKTDIFLNGKQSNICFKACSLLADLEMYTDIVCQIQNKVGV